MAGLRPMPVRASHGNRRRTVVNRRRHSYSCTMKAEAEADAGGEPLPQPPDAGVDGRKLRAAAQAVLDRLSQDLLGAPGVERDRMFGSVGLKVNGKFFAFVGREGRLILKLPPQQAADLVAAVHAHPVSIGRRRTREWVGLPMPVPPADTAEWERALADAHRYVAAITAPGTAGKTSSEESVERDPE